MHIEIEIKYLFHLAFSGYRALLLNYEFPIEAILINKNKNKQWKLVQLNLVILFTLKKKMLMLGVS